MEEKLTKAKLYRKIHKPFLEMGYLEFASKNIFYGMYVKAIDDGWYLALLPVIHRFFNDQFTIDMWLSKNTLMNGSLQPWHTCGIRPGYFLEEARDVWWEGLCQESFDDFLNRFCNIAEPKVISQVNAISEIVESSKHVSEVVQINAGVYNEYVKLFGNPSDSFESFNLQKPIKTPDSWFIAETKYYEQQGSIEKYADGMAADMAFMEWMAREYASRMKK